MRFLKVVRQTCWLFPQQGKFTICSVDCACAAQCLLRFSSLDVYVGEDGFFFFGRSSETVRRQETDSGGLMENLLWKSTTDLNRQVSK